MRKSTKLAILVAALVAICSLTAVAAGWTNEGGTWYYLDKDGDYVTSAWKADGANYYWLDEDGAMATNMLVEDGDKLYYVGADGARVANTWMAVEADDADAEIGVDHRWYYFQSNGKAYKDKTVTIGDQKYHFDQDGKMVFGFVDEKCEIINDKEDAPLGAWYYFGDNDNGAMYTGWLKYEEGFTTTDKYDDLSEVWFWFDTTKAASKRGLKMSGDTKKIGGITYLFDEDGVMLSEWQAVTDATPAGASTSEYFSADIDGHLVKNQWIWKVPSADINATDNDDETSRWFYAKKDGELVTNCTKKINGKYYTFDKNGIMKAGLVFMTFADDADETATTPTNMIYTQVKNSAGKLKNPSGFSAAGLQALDLAAEKAFVYYFSGDEAGDGSMKTGTYKIDLDDDTYTFTFDKHGRALNGVNSNKVYVYGMLLTAGDSRYAVVENTVPGDEEEQAKYLVSSTGTIIKSGKYVKDANDDYYATYADEDGVQQCVKILDTEDAAKAAKEFAKTGKKSYTTVKYFDAFAD